MISDPKIQHSIIGFMVILGIISAFSITSSTSYYTGTVYMVRYLDVSLEELRIRGMDFDNKSKPFSITLVFNFNIPDVPNGSVRLTTLGTVVTLNHDELSYTSFSKLLNVEDGILYPNFNRNYSITGILNEQIDRFTIYNASVLNTWNFSLTFRYFYRTFASRIDEVRFLVFNTNDVTFS